MEKIPIAVSFHDSRGDIMDLLDNEVINAVTIITFTKGAVRANHYHKHTTQWNYVLSGKIRIIAQFPGEKESEMLLGSGEFVATKPNESHALQALEDSEVLILTKGPRGGKEYETDTFRLGIPLIAPNIL